MGNKAQRGKTQLRSPERTGDRALAAEAAEPQCRAWDPHPTGASRPRSPRSALLCAARRSPPGRGGKPGRPRDESCCRASSSGRESLTTPALRAGAADSAWPGQAPTHTPGALTRQCAHPGAGGAGSQSVSSRRQSVSPEVASGATSRGWRRGRVSAAINRRLRARRWGARRQRSRLGSVVPRRAAAARRQDPLPSLRRQGAASPPCPAGVLWRTPRPHPAAALQARRATALRKSRAVSLEEAQGYGEGGCKGS